MRIPENGAGAAAVALAELYTAERQLAARRSAIHKWPNRRHSMRQQAAERMRLAAAVAERKAALRIG